MFTHGERAQLHVRECVVYIQGMPTSCLSCVNDNEYAADWGIQSKGWPGEMVYYLDIVAIGTTLSGTRWQAGEVC